MLATDFSKGVVFSDGNETITVKGNVRLPSPLIEDVNRSFSFYQYRGDETNIERVKQLSTLSMTINGEFAPPFNFKSCDYTNILFRARTKSDS